MAQRAQEYDSLVEPLVHAAVTIGAWGHDQHANLATRMMTSLAAATEDVRGGYTAYLNIRSYALLPVLYAGALGAVARRNGRMLNGFVAEPVSNIEGQTMPLVIVVNPWWPFEEMPTAASVFARVGLFGGTAEEQLDSIRNGKVGK